MTIIVLAGSVIILAFLQIAGMFETWRRKRAEGELAAAIEKIGFQVRAVRVNLNELEDAVYERSSEKYESE